MINKILFNKNVKDFDFDFDFDIVNDYVYYYDIDNDIVIVNDIKKVYDIDFDKDKDFDIDFDNDKVIKECYKILDNVNDILNKYVYDIIFDIDIDNVFEYIKDNDNVFVLDNNLKYIDFDNDNDFVMIKINKDIYNDNYFDFVKDNVFVLSYCLYNYDNNNVNVIVKKRLLNFVLDNINYVYSPLSLTKTINFLNSQIDKEYINIYKIGQQRIKTKSLKQRQRFNQLMTIKSNNINKIKNKLNVINDNIKDIEYLRQYIIKNNCYFDNLNNLKNFVYKSFKNDNVIDLKDKVNDINNDNKIVNDNFKNVKDNVFYNDIDFDKDFDINLNFNVNNIDFDIDKDFVNDIVNDINKVLNDFKKSNDFDKGYILKDIVNDLNKSQYDFINDKLHYLSLLNDFVLYDIVNDIVNDIDNDNDIDKVLNNYQRLLKDNYFDINIVKDIVNDILKSQRQCQSLLNDFVFDNDFIKNIDFDFINDIVNDIINVNDIIKKVLNSNIVNINNHIELLDIFIDFLTNIKVKDNDNDFIYDIDIFKSSNMNKHNTIIKKEQSDFLKVAFNEDMTEYYYTE